MYSRALLLSLLPLTSFAHFHLVYPPTRGFSEDTIVDFPCGGFDKIQDKRTPWPLTGNVPIQLSMEHTSVKGEVLMALGNDPGVNYNIVLKKVFQETGPENFCIGDVTLPAGLNLTAGMNATIQVVTNGDPNGGLYACTDITFTDTPLSSADYDTNCKNSTGVSASFVGGANPNGTASTASGTSASGSTGASATSKGAAAQKTMMAGWALGAVGVIGGLAAL